MTDVRARFPMASGDMVGMGFPTFMTMLADWCSQYVDEVAIPVMVCARELYEDLAVRRLLACWHVSRDGYEGSRHRYLRSFSSYDADMPPYMSGAWTKDECRAYNDALTALLVR